MVDGLLVRSSEHDRPGPVPRVETALLSELVGPTDSVTTMDIDSDVTAHARSVLGPAGYDRVELVHAHGPGADGLAVRLASQARVWDRDHRHDPGPVFTVHPARPRH